MDKFIRKLKENRLSSKLIDKDKERRVKEQLCKDCYYSGFIGCDVLQQSKCGLCGETFFNISSNIDALCYYCAKDNGLCRHCGKEMD